MNPFLHNRLNVALLTIALTGLVLGLGLMVADSSDLATLPWSAGVIPVLGALLVEIVRSLGKGEVGLDIVAALSMSAALFFGETLGGGCRRIDVFRRHIPREFCRGPRPT